MSPSRPFILRPVATALLMVAVLLAGFTAFTQLPVSALPQVDYPIIQVQTFYPGADPEVMASSVTAPLERQFGQIPGLTQMTSTSSGGGSHDYAAVHAERVDRHCAAGCAGRRSTRRIRICRRTCRTRRSTRQGEPGRCADSDACADQRARCRFPCRRSRIWPIRFWRRRSRSFRVWDWYRSAADRSRRCAFRPTRPRWRGTGIRLKTCGWRWERRMSNQAKGSLSGARQSYTIGANDQLLSAAGVQKHDCGLPERRRR